MDTGRETEPTLTDVVITNVVNVGYIDRLVRVVMGCGLLALTLGHVGDVGYVGLPALMSIPILMSAMIGWDPLYALLELDLVAFSFSGDDEPDSVCSVNKETMLPNYRNVDQCFDLDFARGSIATA